MAYGFTELLTEQGVFGYLHKNIIYIEKYLNGGAGQEEKEEDPQRTPKPRHLQVRQRPRPRLSLRSALAALTPQLGALAHGIQPIP
jgi:hypothetical protein